MGKTRMIVTLSLMLALLAGCAAEKDPPAATTVPPTTTEVTQPTTTAPPETTVPPTTEPELEAGWPVTVDGVALESGTVVQNDRTYMKLSEMADALKLEMTEEAAVVWRGEEIRLDPMTYRGDWYVPVAETCEIMGISCFEDTEMGRLYCTPGAGAYVIPEGYNVPVLMYHAVSDEITGYAELHVSPSVMEQQLQYLVENGYSPIWFEDLAQVDQYEKPVILTFDDGYLDNYTELFPLLQKYNVKATIFVITDAVMWGTNYVKEDQVREMVESGLVSIQSHTHTHPYLDECDEETQRQEMEVSKLYILRLTGKEPFVLCYPSGRQNQTTLEIIGDYYKLGIKMNKGQYVTGSDPYRIERYYVSRYRDSDPEC